MEAVMKHGEGHLVRSEGHLAERAAFLESSGLEILSLEPLLPAGDGDNDNDLLQDSIQDYLNGLAFSIRGDKASAGQAA